jgi:hypothetical protein
MNMEDYQNLQTARISSPETTKYLIRDPADPEGPLVNTGLFRDNTLDMLEELSDTQVIGNILRDRLDFEHPGRVWLDIVDSLTSQLVTITIMLRRSLPPEMRRDNIEVKRHYVPDD